MKVKLNNQVYDLDNELDRTLLEYMAKLAHGKPTLQQFLLRKTGVDITKPIDQGKKQDYGKLYREAIEKNIDYGKQYRDAIERSREYFDKKNNERNSNDLETVVEDAIESEAVGLSPEAQRYYEMKDKTIPEFEGRKSQLAEWANNFKHLAQKNYDERLKRGDEMARRANLGLTTDTFTQIFKDDKMMSIIEKEYTPASDYQVPNFDPDGANLNTGDKQRPGNFEYDPNYVDFNRNNTVPMEVVPVWEQLGI